jgi:predicted TIM-barrel fold metal-dependent hydrolase
VCIFDCHLRVVSDDHERYPHDDFFGHKPPWIVERPKTTEQMLAEMDEAGIEKAILVSSPIVYGFDNTYTADSVDRHPDRFGSTCAINVRDADAAAQLRHWIVDRRMNGLRIFTSGGTMPEDSDWLADPQTYPAWETARELGISVSITMKPGGYPQFVQLAQRFSSVPIIMDHLCSPPFDDGPPFRRADPFFALADLPNVYLKLTARNLTDLAALPGVTQPFVQRLVDVWGADRIIWGSNYPRTEGPLAALVQFSLRELAFLPESQRAAIFGGTASQLYPVLTAQQGQRT